MDPLKFCLGNKIYNNRQHNRRNNEWEAGGLKSHKVHSSLVAGAWIEMNFAWSLKQTGKCVDFYASFFKNAQEEKPGECMAKKTKTLVICNDMDIVTKIAV